VQNATDDESSKERPSAAERSPEFGGAGLGRGGWMSRQRKRDAVLRLLRGEDLETVSRALGVTAATLSGWRDAFLDGGEASLASKPAYGEERGSDRLKVRLGKCWLSANCWSRRSSCWKAVVALWPAGGRGHEPHALADDWQALRHRPGLPDLAHGAGQRLSAPPFRTASPGSTRTVRSDAGHSPAGADPRCPVRQPFP
jgi:transposase